MVNLRSHTTRLGVLDIGSNTIHMLIVDAAPGARPDPEASTKSTVRLMKYLKDDGSIKKSGIEAILEAVSQCMRLAEEYEITQLLVQSRTGPSSVARSRSNNCTYSVNVRPMIANSSTSNLYPLSFMNLLTRNIL